MTNLDAMSGAPVPFVVGSARSGTTLVRAMLDAHPQLAVPGESHFIPRLLARRRRFERRTGVDVQRLCDDLAKDRYFTAWGLPAHELRPWLERMDPARIEDAIRAVYECYARCQGKPRWGDKTPAYVVAMRPISRAFPEVRFVHVIRDGRDVACSLMDLGWAGSIEDAALRWSFRVRRGRRAAKALSPGRYLEIRYEDLVADAGMTLRTLCDFLELPFDARMTQPHRNAEAVLATLTNPQNHRNLHEPPARIRDWREQMSDRDAARFDAVAGDLLEDLGYGRSSYRIGMPSRALAATRRATSLPRRLAGRWKRTAAAR